VPPAPPVVAAPNRPVPPAPPVVAEPNRLLKSGSPPEPGYNDEPPVPGETVEAAACNNNEQNYITTTLRDDRGT